MGGRWHPGSCWACGSTVAESGHISASGLCPECGERHYEDNLAQLRAKSGPMFRHWRARAIAGIASTLTVDEAAPSSNEG